MDTIFSQSFLRLYTLKILEMTVGRNKLSAKYRSADWDSLVGWWTSELVSWWESIALLTVAHPFAWRRQALLFRMTG